MNTVSGRTIERLFLYRRALQALKGNSTKSVFSHDIALAAGVTSEQVRRDLMEINCQGSKKSGYNVEELLKYLEEYFSVSGNIRSILIGVGNLGRALLSYFSGNRAHITIQACFDADSTKVNRVINGCRCHPLTALSEIINSEQITCAILAVPEQYAQNIAELLTSTKVNSIINFAPCRLRLPERIFVEDIDITLSIEKSNFLAANFNKNTGDAP